MDADHLLFVATDRISAYDVILNQQIPDKGKVLAGLSLYFFDYLDTPNHLVGTDLSRVPGLDEDDLEGLRGRSMVVRRAEVIPVEFILVKHPTHAHADLHHKALANGLAQAQALMLGKTTQEALAESAPTASKSLDAQTIARHRTFPGNRPSTTLVLDRLTPRALGALIALYEHAVFVAGTVWAIDSFDQWGVELGKQLAKRIVPELTAEAEPELRHDASTSALIRHCRARRAARE